ncbi:uncharacterized protein BYT42DRAFT_565248 [Radiomyces spectabilis]|uniref:uncharacterized protein n=1 Tax=Radiomyces spectabilis TaxID=64574 RepID=UPI00221FC71C|nr:uncharacterized protein BYT42DRAFT_591036 [Radiomyces spectabilis]XP_051424385.1 uncharacterized protein BYT42DRAFT_565248 [Radiomyces spectabilis]KAI8364131.1 hypothetical protein BYT42DRAFT_591036 [Radiomyces spectabilis]KAI8381102.1 hypothetical protein BYT42DRAFT_565248 [Radiomyces spectabilis]
MQPNHVSRQRFPDSDLVRSPYFHSRAMPEDATTEFYPRVPGIATIMYPTALNHVSQCSPPTDTAFTDFPLSHSSIYSPSPSLFSSSSNSPSPSTSSYSTFLPHRSSYPASSGPVNVSEFSIVPPSDQSSPDHLFSSSSSSALSRYPTRHQRLERPHPYAHRPARSTRRFSTIKPTPPCSWQDHKQQIDTISENDYNEPLSLFGAIPEPVTDYSLAPLLPSSGASFVLNDDDAVFEEIQQFTDALIPAAQDIPSPPPSPLITYSDAQDDEDVFEDFALFP